MWQSLAKMRPHSMRWGATVDPGARHVRVWHRQARDAHPRSAVYLGQSQMGVEAYCMPNVYDEPMRFLCQEPFASVQDGPLVRSLVPTPVRLPRASLAVLPLFEIGRAHV